VVFGGTVVKGAKAPPETDRSTLNPDSFPALSVHESVALIVAITLSPLEPTDYQEPQEALQT
jgi:hypothetical protein